MLIATLALLSWTAIQPPVLASDPVVLNAALGGCSADFSVVGADGEPAYAAVIRARIRYGAMSIKRMDVEVSTGPDGKARLQGLPAKAKALAYDVTKGPEKGAALQDVRTQCNATFAVALK